MLTELHIENFAIIQNLELQPGPGLVVFTGETGAGKSIILDAIVALVGGRVEPEMVRSGADRALVEALFTLPEDTRAEVLSILKAEDLADDETTLSLSREIRREGRTTARVNGRSVPLALLRQLGGFLIDIHGQSEHLSLLDVKAHLGLLDRFCGLDARLAEYRQYFHQMQAVRRELAALRQGEKDAARLTDLLEYQAREIEAARLNPGEDLDLRQERDRLANSENLASQAQLALQILDESTPETPAVTDQMGIVTQALAAISRMDASQQALAEQFQELEESLAEMGRQLRDYLDQIEFNPKRLQQIEERLELIQNLKRKYGGSEQAAIEFAGSARRQLEGMAHAGERIDELAVQEETLLTRLGGMAESLSLARQAGVVRLGAAIEAQLDDLHMAGARFSVDLQTRPDPQGLPLQNGERVAFDSNGCNQVEFLIAPNPGEGLKPLVKIASGGETSRLMLALKNVLAQADPVPTLIFDEIDQGIGGRAGTVVGEKLWQLARRHQVFCVTHLPQLAAFGDRHFGVRKQVEQGRTLTHVEGLEGSGRLEELAQMLGGSSQANLSAASEALESARQRTAGPG